MELRRVAMTENEAIREFQNIRPHSGMIPVRMAEAVDTAIQALEEVQQYHKIGSLEECIKNKDFLDFLSDKMNPNDFETYLRLYNALEEKGCEE